MEKSKGIRMGKTPPPWQEAPRCPRCHRWLLRTPPHDPPGTPLDKRRFGMVWFCGKCQREVPDNKIPWPDGLPRPQEVIDALSNYLSVTPAPQPGIRAVWERLELLPTVQRVREALETMRRMGIPIRQNVGLPRIQLAPPETPRFYC